MAPLTDLFAPLISALWASAPWLLPLVCLYAALAAPLPGRGPRTRDRDPWRGYKFALRTEVLSRAQHRCEGANLGIWFRCGSPATQVDHVYPWSRGGPTIASNAQALCAAHNRNKRAMTPPWWYVLSLEHRRRRYFPDGISTRVQAHPALAELGHVHRTPRQSGSSRT